MTISEEEYHALQRQEQTQQNTTPVAATNTNTSDDSITVQQVCLTLG
jgi:hypothetical protein